MRAIKFFTGNVLNLEDFELEIELWLLEHNEAQFKSMDTAPDGGILIAYEYWEEDRPAVQMDKVVE